MKSIRENVRKHFVESGMIHKDALTNERRIEYALLHIFTGEMHAFFFKFQHESLPTDKLNTHQRLVTLSSELL